MKPCTEFFSLSSVLKSAKTLALVGLALSLILPSTVWAKPKHKVEACLDRYFREAIEGKTAQKNSTSLSVESPSEANALAAQKDLLATSVYDRKHDSDGKAIILEARNQAYKKFPRNLVGPGHNLGVAVVEIQGSRPISYKAFSGATHLDGFENGSPNENLRPLMNREHDSEIKILSDLTKTLPRNARGKITLYTERIPCPSCSLVIRNFKKLYPGIQIEIPKLSTWTVH